MFYDLMLGAFCDYGVIWLWYTFSNFGTQTKKQHFYLTKTLNPVDMLCLIIVFAWNSSELQIKKNNFTEVL